MPFLPRLTSFKPIEEKIVGSGGKFEAADQTALLLIRLDALLSLREPLLQIQKEPYEIFTRTNSIHTHRRLIHMGRCSGTPLSSVYKAYYGLSTNSMATVAVQGRTNNLVSINPMPIGANYVYVTSVNNAGVEAFQATRSFSQTQSRPPPQNLVRQIVITVTIP